MVRKHEEEIIKAGHDLSGRPIADIIPKETVQNLNNKAVRLKHKPKIGNNANNVRVLPEIRSQNQYGINNNREIIPASK